MKFKLPLIFVFLITLWFFFCNINIVHAASTPLPSPVADYVDDPEVNFVGKAAARSVSFLNWTLQNYEWSCFIPANNPQNPNPNQPTSKSPCSNDSSPIMKFWETIRNITYVMIFLVVIITAFILIASRGKSLTIQRFLPRFIVVVLLVTLSYSLIQFIYQTTDLIQGFFLTTKTQVNGINKLIDSSDLLYVGWDYENFRGLRKVGTYFDEAVSVNLLLTRITAVTYYATTGVLVVRKIILWFFIILSPVFPILLLYYPVRNTSKIWIGEFFRWLLYAPLYSIFLSGLVALWKSDSLPLIFNFTGVNSRFIYPTATNILLGGPGQIVSETNNLNLPDTFALYVVALIMLWVILILPFILLQIFLDYLNNISFSESPAYQKLLNTSYSLLNRPPPAQPSGPMPPGSTGTAKNLPFAKFSLTPSITQNKPIGETVTEAPVPFSSMKTQINDALFTATNISLPTIKDIAAYETAMLKSSDLDSQSTTRIYYALQQISNPAVILNPLERDKFIQLREQLINESQRGNPTAAAVLSAANITTNVSNRKYYANQITNLRKNINNINNQNKMVSKKEKEIISKLHDSLMKESQSGNNLANMILGIKADMSAGQINTIKEQILKESSQGSKTATKIISDIVTSSQTGTLQSVIKGIADPSTVTSDNDRVKMQALHDSLIKESQKGNSLATMILSAKGELSQEKFQNIAEALNTESSSGNILAQNIFSTAFSMIQSNDLNNILQKITNSDQLLSISEKDQTIMNKVHERIVKESRQGNGLATEILSLKDNIQIPELLQLKAKLEKENMTNNDIATLVLATSLTREQGLEVNTILKEIANPSAYELEANENIVKINSFVVGESKNGNALASSILNIKESFSNKALQDIKNDLIKAIAEGNETAANIMANILNLVDANSIQKIVKQIAHPEIVTSSFEKERFANIRHKIENKQQQSDSIAAIVSSAIKIYLETEKQAFRQFIKNTVNYSTLTAEQVKEKIEQIRKVILTEKEKGNNLAVNILNLTQSASSEDTDKLINQIYQELAVGNIVASKIISNLEVPVQVKEMTDLKDKLRKAKEKNDELAVEILSLFKNETPIVITGKTNLPVTNRIQTVSLEDYDEVRRMWQDNYNNLDVPLGFNDRKDWINEEIETIDNLIQQLSSQDEDKIKEGMREVGNILPFLLLGGFSQEEIIAYLRAKKEAGKSVLELLEQQEKEEDTLVSVGSKNIAEEKSKAQAQEIAINDKQTETSLPNSEPAA